MTASDLIFKIDEFVDSLIDTYDVDFDDVVDALIEYLEVVVEFEDDEL